MRRFPRLLLVFGIAWLAAQAARADDAGGIRKIESRHLTLYTDLPPDDEVDALPGYFDQAFDQWCAYFGLDAAGHADWHVKGCLIRTSDRFAAAGLLPADVPQFPNAYSRASELWMHEQTSVYYRRHLLLHEGTHCFMHMLLGGTGPPWFAEGLAELLATHRLDDGRLVLAAYPRARDEVSKWGRIEIVQNAFAERRAKTLSKIFAFDGTLHADLEAYGWCWAAAAFFDGHPRYRDRFRQLHRHVAADDFDRRVADIFAADADRLIEDWQLFVANVDYGYDFARMDVERSAGKPLAEKSRAVDVVADRGWQSTGIALVPGKTYRLRAAGRYQVAQGDQTWTSEPGGVTIEYYHGQPLGILLAAVRSDDRDSESPSGLVLPTVVGLDRSLVVNRPGTLYLRINDSAGSLADNSGTAQVEITQE